EHGLTHLRALGMIVRGWALAEQGQGDEGIDAMQQGLSAWQATGARGARPVLLGSLAEGYGKSGRVEDGLRLLTEGLAVINATGERRQEAELYRLKGELVLQSSVQHQASDVQHEVEAYFRQALTIAQHQQAKSWELRAAMSLARLWQQQGERVKACELLVPIYAWFTEGFETADLQEAKALVEELSP